MKHTTTFCTALLGALVGGAILGMFGAAQPPAADTSGVKIDEEEFRRQVVIRKREWDEALKLRLKGAAERPPRAFAVPADGFVFVLDPIGTASVITKDGTAVPVCQRVTNNDAVPPGMRRYNFDIAAYAPDQMLDIDLPLRAYMVRQARKALEAEQSGDK